MCKCNKKCLSCPYSECINDTVTALDFLDIVDLEKELGIYQLEDEQCFYEELEYFVRRDRRRERQAEYMRQIRQAR